MSWLEITCEIASTLAQQCTEALETLGAVSVSYFDAGNDPILEPEPGTTPLWDQLKIVGLFPEQTKIESLKQSLFSIFPTLTFSVKSLAEQDWTRAWLDHFQPMPFGERLWISPSEHIFSEENHPDKVIVKLDPGLAFGTGTHPTTALCLRWLDKNPPVNQTIVDYGCGSGILAIAALKLGAQKAWAVDHDPQALTATEENGKRNNIHDGMLYRVSPSELPTLEAQTILANILAKPLISLASTLAEHCVLGGHLVLSGLLTHQEKAVQAAYEPWFQFETFCKEEDWVLLAGRKIK